MAIKHIDASTLKDWLDNRKAVLIDVREPHEHASENIPGAISLPLNSISAKDLPATGDKKIVLQCRAGKRSLSACEKLSAEDNALELYSLDGGIEAWEKAGYPVNKAG
ncbi:rhodanese-like domain-containing protein [Legionella jordanis]|uniref:Rhodanese domain protein n=1 Tax=Legionella jordanis TaxID=456 RepID=A0A0W0VDG1_9GAMM|nr:rhodanese-like domain-containing protein [Legionella jordanis]KTD18162.1 Rhodanese domain protein [Legionella jordanis]RMX01124.1 rhodanese-like domain-containing protein [Legionella jordanis]RMX21354.1 rhodanese-like domain-containing protein [Legionella jordanis]VEH13745.1 rhodanese domain-containing protein [Legionella jordanis]HAT8714544.1 rhodanese-like domain-containing protein [Legionella jordanis]